MKREAPTIKQTNWFSMIPHLFIMGILILTWYFIRPEKAFLYGAFSYLFISFLLRNLIPRDHRNGIKNTNSEKFEEAIKDFKKSYAFFKKYEWIDTYRFIALLSSSKMSYREMALVNIGFCYSQNGDGQTAKKYYEKALKEFPENQLAKSALRIFKSIENSTSTNSKD